MKIVHSWLRDLAPLPDDIEAIAAALSDLGLAVDGIGTVAAPVFRGAALAPGTGGDSRGGEGRGGEGSRCEGCGGLDEEEVALPRSEAWIP